MPIPFHAVFPLLLRFLRNNPLIRLLSRTPVVLFKVLRLVFNRKSSFKQLSDGDEAISQEKDNAHTTTTCYDHVTPSITCASRVPDIQHPHIHPSTSPPSSSQDMAINIVDSDAEHSPHTPDNITLQGQTSVHSQSSRSVNNVSQLQSHLPLNSMSTPRSLDGERAPILPSTIHSQIDCMLSIDLSRYTRSYNIPPTEPLVVLPALETKFASPTPSGWTKFVHPGGWPYWCDKRRKVLTDVNLLDNEILKETLYFVDIIFDYVRAQNFQLEEDVELVVKVVKYEGDEDYRCGYYFAHHKSRSLFWLQDFDLSYALWDAQAQTSLSHIYLEIQISYWLHWEFFCNVQTVTEDMLNELTDMLITSLIDNRTSEAPVFLFAAEELHSYLQAVEISRKLIGTPCRGSPWFIGRLMGLYVRHRFVHFYGEYDARLLVHHREVRHRSWLVNIVSPFLFNAPDGHLRELHLIFFNDLPATQLSQEFFRKLKEEWQDFVINAAVLLAANVAFLAIQSVDNVKGAPGRSPSQIASYLSTLTSISCIIVGLLLICRHRTKGRDRARAAGDHLANRDYLTNRHYRIVGHEPLAILFSLPYAFLMWSILFFLITFVLVCLLDTSFVTRLLSGITAFICVGLIVWCIRMNRDRELQMELVHESKWNLLVDFLSQRKQNLKLTFQGLCRPFTKK